jgi:Predicted membrane protein
MSASEVGYWMGLAAVAAFAITAVAAIKRDGVDFFGVLVLGAITSVGGGTLRDAILNAPIFWAEDLSYLWVALAASALAFFTRSLFTEGQIYSIFLYLDAFGAAFFAILATEKVWKYGFGLPLGPVILGVVTAIGGGLMRDVLAGRRTLLMSRELYAVPMTIGCVLFATVLALAPQYRLAGAAAGVTVSFLLRAAAIRWNLHMPRWLVLKG